MLVLWPLLLPFAAASGWWIGHRPARRIDKTTPPLRRDYFMGLNYLINEEHDKAIDIFLKLLRVDNDTAETHLALGSLFRRRGEVDRAIRIHQNLIARPQLTTTQRNSALLALGRDYLHAGVFDRAERIFQEVATSGGESAILGLRYLLDIYQQEKAWQQAVNIAHQLETLTGEPMHRVISHHYCELAEAALLDRNFPEVAQHLGKALYVDRDSVRASLLQAKLSMQEGRYREAIKAYQRVKSQNPDFISEIIEPLLTCYQAMNNTETCLRYLKTLHQEHPRGAIILMLAEHLRQSQGIDPAIDYLAAELRHYPSIRGLQTLIHWHIDASYGKVREKLEVLRDITAQGLKNKPIYRCNHCGFSGNHLHWQCPGCKAWDTVTPIHGLEGD